MKKNMMNSIFKISVVVWVSLFSVLYGNFFFQSSYAAERNIIVFVTDDESPTLGCYGDSVAVTPAIDALADDGVTRVGIDVDDGRKVDVYAEHARFGGQSAAVSAREPCVACGPQGQRPRQAR